MVTKNGSRVLMIGLDSADLDYIEPRLSSLPNLKRIFSGGVVRRLETPASVMSASPWPTFYTASHPGHHGQYFPIQWDPASMQMRHVDRDWLDCEPFWRPLAREGLPVTTLDVQMVYPSRTPDGVELVNWGSNTLGGFECNRPEVGREVERLFGRHVLPPDIPVDKSPERFAAIRKVLLTGIRQRGELSRWLMKNTRWKLFITVFQECHRAGHYYWKESNEPAPDSSGDGTAMLEVHRALDREIGEILGQIDERETTVMVFSLLGMGANRVQMHLVPEIIQRINERFASSGTTPVASVRPRRSVMGLLREHLPAPVQERLALITPTRLRDWVVGRAYAGAIDWSRTPGFALPTGGEGFIRVNLAGREAKGWIERGSDLHRRYLDAVREGFLSLTRVGTGEPLADAVILPAERFPGPRADYLPDVAVTWRPGGPATSVHSDLLGDFRGRLRTGRDGNHRAVAFAAVAGPAKDLPRTQSLGSVLDLATLVRDLAVGRA